MTHPRLDLEYSLGSPPPPSNFPLRSPLACDVPPNSDRMRARLSSALRRGLCTLKWFTFELGSPLFSLGDVPSCWIQFSPPAVAFDVVVDKFLPRSKEEKIPSRGPLPQSRRFPPFRIRLLGFALEMRKLPLHKFSTPAFPFRVESWAATLSAWQCPPGPPRSSLAPLPPQHE